MLLDAFLAVMEMVVVQPRLSPVLPIQDLTFGAKRRSGAVSKALLFLMLLRCKFIFAGAV